MKARLGARVGWNTAIGAAGGGRGLALAGGIRLLNTHLLRNKLAWACVEGRGAAFAAAVAEDSAVGSCRARGRWNLVSDTFESIEARHRNGA